MRQLAWCEAIAQAERGLVGEIREDSRQVVPGDVFVAIRGRSFDGHLAVQEAAARGAAFCVVEEPVAAPVPLCLVPDTREALAQLAAARYGYPGRELCLVGITGTNGKTTSAVLLRRILERAGIATGLIGTLGARVDEPYHYTTPPAPQLQRTLRRLADGGARVVVMEVSSHALDQKRVGALAFQAAALTNVTRDHLDYHADMQAYKAAKRKLFDLLAPGGPVRTPAAVLPWGSLGDEFGQGLAGVRVHRYGLAPACEVNARDVRPEAWSTRFTLVMPGGTVGVLLPLPGGYNLKNALCAAALAQALGVEREAIAAGLSDPTPVPGRLERIRSADGVTVVVDYAHNPAGLRAVLEAVRASVPGRVISLFGARGNRDRGKLPRMGKVAGILADLVVLTTDSPGPEDPYELLLEIRRGLTALRCPPPVEVELDRRRAIARAIAWARPGDAVVITGRGDEPSARIGDRLVVGTDRAWVEEALAARGALPREAAARRAGLACG